MYFREEPKTAREDFYNCEEELQLLESSIKRGNRLILVLGPRRIGKTSLLLVGLNELGVPYLLLDGRIFSAYPFVPY